MTYDSDTTPYAMAISDKLDAIARHIDHARSDIVDDTEAALAHARIAYDQLRQLLQR